MNYQYPRGAETKEHKNEKTWALPFWAFLILYVQPFLSKHIVWSPLLSLPANNNGTPSISGIDSKIVDNKIS